MTQEIEAQKKKMFIFYLLLVGGLILFIVIDQIRIHYKDVKLDEVRESQKKMVEDRLYRDIHLLNDSYKENLTLFQKRDSIRTVELNKLITINSSLRKEIKKEVAVKNGIQYKIDSIDEKLFLPNPYEIK